MLDLTMPGVRGFSGLMYLRAQYPSVPVVVVSANDDPAVIRRCMDFGGAGFVPKTLGIDVIRAAIMRVLEGGVWTPPDVDLGAGTDAESADLLARLASLTPQQVRVLMMLSGGLLNKQIAYELGVSEATVKAHVSAILQKLNVESRTQAVITASKIEARAMAAGGAARQLKFRGYSAATARLIRTCVISARSAAGLTGLLSSSTPCARASSRTSGLRSAVIRMAVRSAP